MIPACCKLCCGAPSELLLMAAPCLCPAGQRALSFVLQNQGFVDRTLLFDIELVKVLS